MEIILNMFRLPQTVADSIHAARSLCGKTVAQNYLALRDAIDHAAQILPLTHQVQASLWPKWTRKQVANRIEAQFENNLGLFRHFYKSNSLSAAYEFKEACTNSCSLFPDS